MIEINADFIFPVVFVLLLILLLYDNWRISKIEEFIENKFGHDLYSQEKEMKGGVDYGK